MEKKRVRLVVLIAPALIAAAALFGICVGVVFFRGAPQGFSGFAMGSLLDGTVWVTGLPYPGLSGDFARSMQSLEDELLTAEEAPPLALEIYEASGGAFSPYLGALTKLWSVDDEPYLPTQAEINQALQKRELDLGAYGKGAACDEALDMITSMTMKGAVVNLGGNIATYGRKPWNKPFRIALRDPKGEANQTIGVFTLKGTHFISTSGSYEKYFERDGKRYHHIFDPETGYPAERDPGLVSVTVINDHGATGDALSTAAFVLGYEDSQSLLQKYSADAIFIYESGAVKYTGSVEDYFKLENK